jgi:methylmalonyl-CoA mutase N-terminal domain/subunit
MSGSRKRWEDATLKRTLDKNPERKKEFALAGGIPVERLYTPEDVAGFEYDENLGYPGEFPFTRGVQPTMYRGRFWTMRQYAGFKTAKETNARYHYLLKRGQTGLSVAFDLPTQVGYDSDDPHSYGEVGKVGVPISSLADMETLFAGIDLSKVSTSMTINSTASVILAMYAAVAKKGGADVAELDGTIQNDILKEYIARGTFRYPVAPSMRIVTDIFKFCSAKMPKWNMISISGYHIREAGSTAVQELAFTFADAIAYVEKAVESGQDVDSFAGRLSFFFGSHNNILEEVAKFRAARRIWAKIVRDRFHSKNPRSQMLRFHTQTAGCTLTREQYELNAIRVAFQALSAVLGGTQSLHTNSRDEAFALPSEDSVRIALRTQQLIANETGVADTIDPLAGSFCIEALTNEIERRVLVYLKKIDDMGGAVAAIERGYPQREIQDSAYAYQKAIEKKEMIVVGVNEFREEEAEPPGLLKIDDSVREERAKELKTLRGGRDNGAVKSALKRLKDAARSKENLMEPMLEAVEAYATLGEICEALADVFGEYEGSEYY